MRLFSKYYDQCSTPVYRSVHRAVLRARRAGCPRDVFSPLHRPDSAIVLKMNRFGQRFFDHLLLIDTMNSVAQWCMNRSIVIIMRSNNKDDTLRASGSLNVFIYCQMLAIRLLVINGLDTQARGCCRPLREATSLLVLVQSDLDLAREFVSAQGPHQANDFWRKYVRKDRAKKDHLEAIFGGLPSSPETIKEILEFINNEESFFSQSIHPSYLSDKMYIFSLMDGGEDEWGFLSKRISLRTLAYSTFVSCNAYFKYLSDCRNDIKNVSLEESDFNLIGVNEEYIREAMLHIVLISANVLNYLNEVRKE